MFKLSIPKKATATKMHYWSAYLHREKCMEMRKLGKRNKMRQSDKRFADNGQKTLS